MTSPKRLSPRRAAEDTLKRLRAGADRGKAQSYQRYFKEPVDLFGLSSKSVEAIRKELLDTAGPRWTIREAVTFCNAMVKDPHFESRAVGYQVVAAFAGEAPGELVADVKRWLQRSSDNWALVDTLAPSVLGPLIERYPDLIPEVTSWTDSPTLWVRRGAVVAFVPLVRKQKRFLAPAYRIATRLLGDDEDLIHKAVGWMLREAGKTDPERLKAYLLKHGPRMPRTAVRYAIERFAPGERKRLLAATRPAPGKRRSG